MSSDSDEITALRLPLRDQVLFRCQQDLPPQPTQRCRAARLGTSSRRAGEQVIVGGVRRRSFQIGKGVEGDAAAQACGPGIGRKPVRADVRASELLERSRATVRVGDSGGDSRRWTQ